MEEVCAQRRLWRRVTTAVAIAGTLIGADVMVWICWQAPNALAAARGVAILGVCVGVTATAAASSVFLWMSNSPVLTAALKLLAQGVPKPKFKPKPPLKLVDKDDKRDTGS